MSAENQKTKPMQLETYVVYFNPTDYPEKYVVRLHVVETGKVTPESDALYIGDSIQEARKTIPQGKINIGRNRFDEKQIMEVWV